MYKNKIVHIIIGNMSYAGALDQEDHPNGKDWLRINEPCVVHINGTNITIAKLSGLPAIYRPYVDIKIPKGIAYLIHVLDKGGILYEAYINEIARKEPDRIIVPGQAGLKAVN